MNVKHQPDSDKQYSSSSINIQKKKTTGKDKYLMVICK